MVKFIHLLKTDPVKEIQLCARFLQGIFIIHKPLLFD